MFRKAFLMAMTAAAIGVGAPAAQADPSVVQIASATRHDDVWTLHQDNDLYRAVVAEKNHGGASQYWELWYDNTIRNKLTGLCATAEGHVVVGRPCNGDRDQEWRGHPRERSYAIENLGTRDCATHDGTDRLILLRTCEPHRLDQTWDVE